MNIHHKSTSHRKPQIYALILAILLLQASAYAGGAPYPWLDIGSKDGKFYGIGEISNNITIFTGDTFWISPIPGPVTYWKEYFIAIIMLTVAADWLHRKRKSMRANNAPPLQSGTAAAPESID